MFDDDFDDLDDGECYCDDDGPCRACRARFADPGGESALHVANADNPRNLPCPNCGEEDRLTPRDVAAGYQCNACADACERGY